MSTSISVRGTSHDNKLGLNRAKKCGVTIALCTSLACMALCVETDIVADWILATCDVEEGWVRLWTGSSSAIATSNPTILYKPFRRCSKGTGCPGQRCRVFSTKLRRKQTRVHRRKRALRLRFAQHLAPVAADVALYLAQTRHRLIPCNPVVQTRSCRTLTTTDSQRSRTGPTTGPSLSPPRALLGAT